MTAPLTALLLFLALQLGIGIWISKRIVSESDYLLGGRSLGYPLTIFSIFATWFGAETVIGSGGRTYEEGVSIASAEPFGYGLCLILLGAIYAVPLWRRGLTTLADLFKQRFGVGVEKLAAVLLIPGSILWAAAQIRAFGQVVASAGELNVEFAIGIAATFTIAYTMFGGLLADAVTDLLQGGILITGLLVLLGAVIWKLGGVDAALVVIRERDGIHLVPATGAPLLETLEAWAIPICGSVIATEMVGRIIAARSPTVAKRSAWVAGLLYIGFGSIPVLIGLMGRAIIPEMADSEQLLPSIAQQLLPTALYAIFTGGLVAAILSTVDSTLLISSGILSHNLLIPAFNVTTERKKVLLARGGVALFGLTAYLLALRAEGVYALVEQASAFGSSGILVTVTFALFTPWGRPLTAAATLLAGVTSYIAAVIVGTPAPFLLSLGTALLVWLLGCALDGSWRRRIPVLGAR